MLPVRNEALVLFCGLVMTLQAGDLQLLTQGAVNAHLVCAEERNNINS